MFTTISNLRNSNAIASRVTRVENYLKRTYPGYTSEMLFPMFEVAASNPQEDYEWVVLAANTHAAGPAALANAVAKISVEFIFRKLSKAQALEELTRQYAAAFVAAGVTDLPWIKKHLSLVQSAPASAEVAAAPAAAAAAPAAAAPAAKPAPNAEAVLDTAIATLTRIGTSKDKRSQILEGMGLPLSCILKALVASGDLTEALATAAASRGVK